MKKLLLFMVILLISTPLVLSLNIEECHSAGDSNWNCEDSDVCTCRISGSCTDGRLLVYEGDIRNLLCMPKIVNGYSDIIWGNCMNPTDEIQVRADCVEGQSSEKTIDIFADQGGSTTTSITVTSTTATSTSTTNGGGGNGNGGGDSNTTSTTSTTTTTTVIPCPYDQEKERS